MDASHCPFCVLPRERILLENNLALAILDGFPISPGHALILPRRHTQSFFEVTDQERVSMLALLQRTKDLLDAKYHPDGYNIGINDGAAAGQTVPHLHVHLIPRYQGDVSDPRGGVRWIFPELADYWTKR
jgi:diadenosine tetraphosphate (Ap4A) HIT family hydrolase